MDPNEVEIPETEGVSQAEMLRRLFRLNSATVFSPKDIKALLPIPEANVAPLLKRLSDSSSEPIRRRSYGRYAFSRRDEEERDPMDAEPVVEGGMRIRWAVPINGGGGLVAVTSDDRVLLARDVEELAA